MEYDQNEYPQSAQPQEEYDAAKCSPFADSPYVTPFDTDEQPLPPQEPKPKKKKCSGGKILLCAVLVLALVAASCLVTAALVNRHWENEIDLLNQTMNNRISVLQEQINAASGGSTSGSAATRDEGMLSPAEVYARNVQSVVAVACYTQQTNAFGQVEEYESFGSGFIITENGYVVTNYHVVEGAAEATVITSDSQEYEAELIGYDATNDIALLKMEAEDLPCVTIGSSSELIVGDQVAAIGNPLGELTSTLTVGYVSAKDRVVTTDGSTINMLQTDAAINSGNSGGPLFNMYGEVVGITTAKYSGTSSSGASIEGIGFAIPMDDVTGMIEDLQEYGYITGAYLGIMCRDLSAYSIQDGLPAGVYVEEVTAGYAAEEAGLQKGDVITNLGGYDVTCMADLTRVLRKFKADDTTTITVYRSGQSVNLVITLDEKPRQESETAQEEVILDPGDEGFEEWYKDFIERHFG